MRLLLVDGTNAVMRYAFAMLGAAQADPRPADGPAVVRAVEKAIRECALAASCDHAAVALDSEGACWRRDLYPEYKATRPGGTGAWSARLRDHLSANGWLCLEAASFEADDIIASLARRAAASGHPTAVLSGDSDLLQLALMLQLVTLREDVALPALVPSSCQIPMPRAEVAR